MSNSFIRFKQRQQKQKDVLAAVNSKFIVQGYSSIAITSGNNITQAVVVNKQEQNKAYIYTKQDYPLTVGSIWGAKTLNWLIAEELIVIKDVHWHKYLAYLCNIQVEDTWGYFIGPEKKYINIVNERGTSLESLQKPVLVLPANILGFADKIVINNRPWLVQEWDAISSPGLVYYSLRATTISKEVALEHAGEDVYIERATNNITPTIIIPEHATGTPIDTYAIGHNIKVNISTTNGYFKSSHKVNIMKHTENEVIFSIPFGIDQVTIITQEEGNLKETIYKAVN